MNPAPRPASSTIAVARRSPLPRAAFAAVVAAALLAAFPSTAGAQLGARVIRPGHEETILEAVRDAFGDRPAAAVVIDQGSIRVDTGEGAALVVDHEGGLGVVASVRCDGGCTDAERGRWSSVAARLRDNLAAQEDEVWGATVTDEPPDAPTVVARGVTGVGTTYLLLALVVLGLLLAPGIRPPGSRTTWTLALLAIAGFVAVALLLSPPRPLHDHLCFIERARCASTPGCDVVHGAWGRSSFHLMGLLLSAVPHRLPWILGLGVVVTAAALCLVYDVTARIARRAGMVDRSAEAGLWAIAVVGLHPGFIRVAGAGSFWPLTLLLVFAAFHLALRATEGRGWRQGAALVAAGAALGLALTGNRLTLVLAPLVVLGPWAWPPRGPRRWFLLAAVAPLVMFVVGVQQVLGDQAYGVGTGIGLEGPLNALTSVPTDGALSWAYSSPLIVPVAAVALLGRARLRAGIPPLYAFVAVTAATLLFTGPLSFDGHYGYPDAYLKHFPQLLLVAPLFGVGALSLGVFGAQHLGRYARFSAPVLAIALLLTAWTRPDARGLLFAERVIEREMAAFDEAVDRLPPHDVIAVARTLAPPEGVAVGGDPLEMHFPEGIYAAALERRGMSPARMAPIEQLAAGDLPEGRVLLYVGSTLRSFYADEVASGRVPESLERPVLRRVRERFVLEPVEVFRVSTDEPAVLANRVAPGASEVELGFYRVRRRGTAGPGLVPGPDADGAAR